MRLSALLGTVTFLGLWDLQLLFLLILWKVKGIAVSVMSNSETTWTIAHQAPLPMEFSKQEYWSDCHAFFQGIFPTKGSSPHLLHHLHWQVGSFSTGATWDVLNISYPKIKKYPPTHSLFSTLLHILGDHMKMSFLFASLSYLMLCSVTSCWLGFPGIIIKSPQLNKATALYLGLFSLCFGLETFSRQWTV